MAPTIRPYRPEDAAAVRACIVELQDAERRIDARLRPGELIAAPFLEAMLTACAEHGGTILVADDGHVVVGFATILIKVRYEHLDDPPGEYALISDLVVRDSSRRRGIGEALLIEAERRAKEAGARELRVSALTQNDQALRLYQRAGFHPYLTTLSKLL